MKKLFLTLFLFLGVSQLLLGQSNYPTWPQPGATWDICRIVYPLVDPDLSYINDTTINNTTYNVIYYPGYYGFDPFLYFTRFSNDTIYRLINNTEYLFFTYDVQLGDTLSLVRTGIYDYDQDTCSYPLKLWHNQVSLISYNNQLYKRWHFQELDNGISYLQGLEYYWLENVGWFSETEWGVPTDFPWLIDHLEMTCGSPVTTAEHYSINYYYDNNTSIEIRPCQTNTSIIEKAAISFELFPNPVQDQLNVYYTGQQEGTLKLTSLEGKVLRQTKVSNEAVTYMVVVDDLAAGVYLVVLENTVGEVVVTKKVVKE